MRKLTCISVILLIALTRQAWADAVPADGNMAPAFALSDQSGREVSLDSLRGKWLVLYSYPKNDTRGAWKKRAVFATIWRN